VKECDTYRRVELGMTIRLAFDHPSDGWSDGWSTTTIQRGPLRPRWFGMVVVSPGGDGLNDRGAGRMVWRIGEYPPDERRRPHHQLGRDLRHGPGPTAAHAEALLAAQRAWAALVTVRQRHASVVDGDALLAAAIVGGWTAAKLEEELQLHAGELGTTRWSGSRRRSAELASRARRRADQAGCSREAHHMNSDCPKVGDLVRILG